MLRLSPTQRNMVRRIVFSGLLLLSATMILLDKMDQVLIASVRVWLTDGAGPVLVAISRPLGAVGDVVGRAEALLGVYRQNARLKEENARLLRWHQAALNLASENAELRDLLKLAPNPALSYVTVRVIGDPAGVFARNLLVEAGREDGVIRGQVAISGRGLVGRVIEAGHTVARILLMTDLNSRIPVIVEQSGQRAILVGDNSERPILQYLDPAAPPKLDDRVVTSGDGGVFPRGLPVGTIAAVDHGKARVEPFVQFSQLGYVRIVDYGLDAKLPQPLAAAPRHGPKGPL